MLNQTEYLDLIVRYLNQPLDEELHAAVNSFCSESESNRSYFLEIEKIWNLSSRTTRLNLLDEKQSLTNFSAILNKNTAPKVSFKWLGGIAASMVLLGIFYWMYVNRSTEQLLTFATKESKDSIVLSDGSTVILAENTIFKYPKVFNLSKRNVYLNKGRAFFKITKDLNHPFRVAMGNSSVSVLGTSFSINYLPSKIDLDVKTGSVIFSPYADGTSSILKAGQGLTYNILKRELIGRISHNSDAWLTKKLVFTDMPLEDVCSDLSDYYKISITLESTKKRVKKFNANFEGNSLEEILEVLKETYGLQINKTGDRIILKSNK